MKSDTVKLRKVYANRSCLELTQEFEDISSGRIQAPIKEIEIAKEFVYGNTKLQRYCDEYRKNMGDFWKHYCASIPFIAEQQCRVGFAILEISRLSEKNKILTFYEMGSQDGTHARTLAGEANGSIKTVTDALHTVNKVNFRKKCPHKHSFQYMGHFFEIIPELLLSYPLNRYFSTGFDFIYENATFQFYDKDRAQQIAHVKQILKRDGIFICLEKLANSNAIEYKNREAIKDNKFKSKYFTVEEINWKKNNILTSMNYEVNYKTLISALKVHFKFAYLIWNSANFYEIIASDSKSSIEKLLEKLPEPYIPEEFNCEKIKTPQRLF